MAATATSPTPERSDENGSLLKTAGSIATAALASFYAVGLLVTNVYLLEIGVTDFNLLRARCVLTGAWATAIIVLMCLPALTTVALISNRGKPNRYIPELPAPFIVLIVAIICCGPEILLTTFLKVPFSFRWLGWYGACSLLLFGSFSLYFYAPFMMKDGYPIPDPTMTPVAAALVVVCVLGATLRIGKMLYPSVSPAFGGGKPITAKLVLSHEGATTWAKVPGGIDYDALAKSAGAISSAPSSEPFLTPDVEILYETDNQIVIGRTDPDEKQTYSIIVLDRKLVSGVVTKHTDIFSPFLQ